MWNEWRHCSYDNCILSKYRKMGRRYENKEGKIMNCFMCKGNIEKKKVNYVVDLEDTIIIIKGVPARVWT